MTKAQRHSTWAIVALLVLYAVLAVYPAMAQTGQAALTCTAPTQNTDGTPLAGAITYKFYRGATAASQTTASPVQTSCAYTFTGLPAGTHYFAATAIVGGAESVKTAPVSKVTASVPNPPTNLTVGAELVAYTIVQSRDRVALVAVGTVAPGTTCDPLQPVLDKHVIPRGSVTFLGTVRPEVVVASCS
jgi:hypothetical protein